MYSTTEKVSWVKDYYAGSSLREVCDVFQVRYPTRPKPAPTTVLRCIRRFERTGNVNEVKTGRRLPPRTTDNALLVLAAVAHDPHTSTRAIAHDGGPSQPRVVQILHQQGFKSYHVRTTQELRPGDPEKRFEFASRALEFRDADPEFCHKIIFTDESSFGKHHSPNRQNRRMWHKGKPVNVYASRTQYPEKLNVWAGIVDHNILGPIFIDGNLTGEKYVSLLQDEVADLVEDLDFLNECWYMHDGCPAHNSRYAREFLHNSFPGCVIGSYEEPLAWPPRSPDLNPLDFFLWGHVTSTIYRTRPFSTLEALQSAIEGCLDSISPFQVADVIQNFEDRLAHCVAADGGLFEHFL